MAYTQIKSPDLSVVGQPLLCLVYSRQVFGVAAKYQYATLAWENAKFAHTDALPNVAVPVWFSWTGKVDGVSKNWGHVAVFVPGKGVYSTPLRAGTTNFVTSTVEQMATAIGGRYLGWSEDINDVRVAQPLGGSMADLINDDVSRQIGWHYLGRNGYDGKPNALASKQTDIFGKPLTNAQLSAFFLSAEARDWRDVRVPKIYAELNALKVSNANLNIQVTQLTKAVAEKQKTIDTLNIEVAGLTQKLNVKQTEVDTLQDEVADLKKENDELKAELATCGDSQDTDYLNKLGELLRWFITRLGVKK